MDTGFPADSIEFCPHPNARDIFVCGTYKLDAQAGDERKRHGNCLVFRTTTRSSCERIQDVPLPGAVLDMKWCHRSISAPPTLAIADSNGSVTLHEWRDAEMRTIDTIPCAPAASALCLSLDWSNRRSPTTHLASLIVSLSNGSLCLLHPTTTGLLPSNTWAAHDFEPWIAAWDYWDTNTIYSGGDDLKMKGWDTRQGFTHPIFVNKRFDAGVTTIQSHPHVEHIIAVGSYDRTVRLFDVRKPQLPLTQADVSGGAWRVKWHPSESRKRDLLVACTHDGFKIVRFGIEELAGRSGDDLGTPWQVTKRFDDHQSLAYGVDWSFEEPEDGQTLIASCSFYDCALHLWSG